MDDIAIGMLEDDKIQICSGDLYNKPQPVGQTVVLDQVKILPPCQPEKFIALWNNFYSRAEKEGWAIPPEPLYFIKTPNSYNGHQQAIKRPRAYRGPVFFEGELGIVIGKSCSAVSEDEAGEFILGYTCINDVTAKEILNRDKSFQQWTRAKGFDTFGVFGPGIVTDIEPHELVIESILDGDIKQHYPVSDMVFQPYKLVSMISRDMTLQPGDVIACGTGLGACAMEDGQTIEVKIEGVGSLQNVMTA
jgi:2-keto-4-pentenoate hydratase/2-oxohepta-3-ene-1,7-dioic acid hydratase in catechol pathway